MSNINITNIDGTFPVAGQDNDSQGFRSNFTNIINNFIAAKTEIEELQAKSVFKTKLDNQITLTNDFEGERLSSASILDFREVRVSPDPVINANVATYTINHNLGHYQKITPEYPFVISFSQFPAAGYLGRVRLEIQVDDVAYTMTLPETVTIGKADIAGLSGNIITFEDTGTYIFEFTSDDGDATYSINDLSRAKRNSSNGTSVLSGNVTTVSSSLSNITGLSFSAKPDARYKFEALIPFTHSAATTSTHTFGVNFASGTCNYLIEQQAGPSSDFTKYASNTSDATGGVETTVSTSMRFAKITGTFTHSESSAVTLALRFATSAGTLTALAGSSLKWERLDY